MVGGRIPGTPTFTAAGKPQWLVTDRKNTAPGTLLRYTGCPIYWFAPPFSPLFGYRT